MPSSDLLNSIVAMVTFGDIRFDKWRWSGKGEEDGNNIAWLLVFGPFQKLTSSCLSSSSDHSYHASGIAKPIWWPGTVQACAVRGRPFGIHETMLLLVTSSFKELLVASCYYRWNDSQWNDSQRVWFRHFTSSFVAIVWLLVWGRKRLRGILYITGFAYI